MTSPLDPEKTAIEELQPDESLIWAGAPTPARVAWGRGTVLLFFFGLVIATFSVCWTLAALSSLLRPAKMGGPVSGMEAAFPFFGAPFLLVGLGLLCSPFLAYRSASQTVYAVTDKRLLIIRRSRLSRIEAINPESLAGISRRTSATGGVDLIFHTNQAAPSRTALGTPAMIPPAGFYGLVNIQEAERAIRSAFPNLSL